MPSEVLSQPVVIQFLSRPIMSWYATAKLNWAIPFAQFGVAHSRSIALLVSRVWGQTAGIGPVRLESIKLVKPW